MAAKPIVAGTDGSEESLRAVDWAAREAALRGAPLRIVAAAAAPPGMRSRAGAGEYERVTDVLLGERDQALAAAAERAAKTAPGVLIDTDPLRGPAAQAVTESGAGAQMLVLGSRGISAFTALLLGSVSRYAASHASCPVVVVRDETPSPHGLVGVGVGDLDTYGDAAHLRVRGGKPAQGQPAGRARLAHAADRLLPGRPDVHLARRAG